MKSRTFAVLGFATLLAAGTAFAQQPKQLSISTGGTGGIYYPLGSGFANILAKNIPGVQATAEVTGGSVANLLVVGTGKGELGMTQVDAAIDALKGQDKFKTPLPIRTLGVMYPNLMQVVTIEGNGIAKFEDLKGKRISTGSPGSATEVFAFRLLEAAGLDKDKDVKRERLGASESAGALKDKKIDAFFFVAGVPTSAIVDVAATPGTKIKMIDHAAYVAKMNEKYSGIYAPAVIPKGAYSGMDGDNQVASVWNLLFANESLSEDLAYQVTKLFFENQADLVRVHSEAGNIKMENQTIAKAAIPFHPGAVKYFKEKGIDVTK